MLCGVWLICSKTESIYSDAERLIFCMIGPDRPCGSITNTRSIGLVFIKSFMMVSPGIDLAVGVLESISFLFCLYFPLSLIAINYLKSIIKGIET